MTNVEFAYEQICDALERLEPIFKGHRLTFVARTTDPALGDADLIVTGDYDLKAVRDAIDKRLKDKDSKP